jgi:hypothetical protein
VVNVRVVKQGFLSGSMDDDITDLIESFESSANAVLLKVDVELILHANLDPSSVGHISSISSHE